MSKARPLLIGAALGASAAFFSLQYHFVRTVNGFQVIPRSPQPSIGLAYTDIRGWTPSQWIDRPELARAIMACGSGDLISESVASSLAEAAVDELSTLDELRALLENPEVLGQPRSGLDGMGESSEEGEKASGQQAPGSEADLFRIPFPQDAKIRTLADPFRVVRSDDEAALPDSEASSRFTAEDILEGLDAPVFPDERAGSPASDKPAAAANSGLSLSTADTPATTAAAGIGRSINGSRSTGSNPGPRSTSDQPARKSIAEQAREMEERIFGRTPPAETAAAPRPQSSAKAQPEDVEFFFEDVTTQLEHRAQEALSRAQDAMHDSVGSAVGEATTASAGYVREKAAEQLPNGAGGLLNSGTTPNPSAASGESAPPPVEFDFDPFLE